MADPVAELVARLAALERHIEELERQESVSLYAKRGAAILPDALMICHFDGPRPFETDFTGDPNGHLGQVPTVSGGVYYRPGKFGKAVVVGEATTNELLNPVFENNVTDGWSLNEGGTGGSLNHDTITAWIGSASLRIDRGTAWTQAISNTITLAAGESVAIQAQVKTDGTGQADIKLRDITNGVVRVVASTTATDWTFLTGTWTNDTGATVTVRMQCNIPNGGANQAWFDACQMEKKPYPTPLCYGDLPGHSWSGTAHASTSSRTAAALQYTQRLNLSAGTIAAWVYANAGLQNDAANRYIVACTENTPSPYANTLALRRMIGGTWRFWTVDGSGNSHDLEVADTLSEGWHHLVATWRDASGNVDKRLYIDGELAAQETTSIFPASLDADLFVGVWATGAYGWTNTFLDDLLVVDRALPAAEARAIYRSGVPVFVPTAAWYTA